MPRVQPKTLLPKDRTELLNEFWFMIASLQTQEEVKNFFKDLLSETEAIMLARRIRIARFLLKGISYQSIKETLKTSDTTIARVHRWLQSGFEGYTKALPRLEQELTRQQAVRRRKVEELVPYSFAWLKRRYPLHFLLFNLFDRATEKL